MIQVTFDVDKDCLDAIEAGEILLTGAQEEKSQIANCIYACLLACNGYKVCAPTGDPHDAGQQGQPLAVPLSAAVKPVSAPHYSDATRNKFLRKRSFVDVSS